MEIENQIADYLNQIDGCDESAIRQIRTERLKSIWSEANSIYRHAFDNAPEIDSLDIQFDQPVVSIRSESDSQKYQDSFRKILEVFCPWKKGPFHLFGHDIDAEWRSDWKWERIRQSIGSLENQVIADIGCHNGYFMFRMLADQPKWVIGIEPVVKHFICFQLLQKYIKAPNLFFELLGVEHMDFYHRVFDKVFCLGILYHHTDPVGLLRKIHRCLKTGGELIVDCQGIAGSDEISLTPRGRYANATGIWFLPTLPALKNWLHRAQFRNIECFFDEPLSIDEQRATQWAEIPSLAEALNPQDPSQTIEGYPAPRRFYVKATR